MRHLNYNHLLYFWVVAREGSIARAAEELHLTSQTISGQLKLLDDAVGEPLFQRVGRGLVLTETGLLVQHYADEIFSLGAELSQRVRHRLPGFSIQLNVGIVDSIPKLIAYRILKPVLSFKTPIHLIIHEGNLEQLLGELAVHKLDVVLSDRPVPTGLNVKAFNHRLGESEIALFAHKRLAAKYKKGFPTSLDEAPMLLPLDNSTLRRTLDDWFEKIGINPKVVAEFDDTALMKTFGEAGSGIFPAPQAIADEVVHMHGVVKLGTVPGVSETYYTISPERKLKHEAVVHIIDTAHEQIFT